MAEHGPAKVVAPDFYWDNSTISPAPFFLTGVNDAGELVGNVSENAGGASLFLDGKVTALGPPGVETFARARRSY
jgi:hypothetical protein